MSSDPSKILLIIYIYGILYTEIIFVVSSKSNDSIVYDSL